MLDYIARPEFNSFFAPTTKITSFVGYRGAGKTVSLAAATIHALVNGASLITYFSQKMENSVKIFGATFKQLLCSRAPFLLKNPRASEKFELVFGPNDVRTVLLCSYKEKTSINGLHPDLAILDEAGFIPNDILENIMPLITDEDSKLILCGTPQSHNMFHRMFMQGVSGGPDKWSERPSGNQNIDGKAAPGYTSFMFKASHSKYISQESKQMQLEALGPQLYSQEFECDFDVMLLPGAPYGEILSNNVRIGNVPVMENWPVDICIDIGGAGRSAFLTCIGLFQYIDGELRIVDYIEGKGDHISVYFKQLREKNYMYRNFFLPHDGDSYGPTAEYSVKTLAEKWGFNPVMLPKAIIPKNSTIQASTHNKWLYVAREVGEMLSHAAIDSTRCEQLINRLKLYQFKIDSESGLMATPVHDMFNSNAADMVRYIWQAKDKWKGNPMDAYKGLDLKINLEQRRGIF